jgi:hypothetical protein
MKGGHALAAPSGARYPQHQSPFHFQYTNLTVAHNALLVNGEGQIDRNAEANGRLVEFKSTPHLAYVAGDAQKCYGPLLDYYQRHVVLIRPAVILVIDDLSGPNPFSVDWLLHSREEITTDPDKQMIESSRFSEAMQTRIFTPDEFDFTLTDEWPIDPKKDYPMVTAEPPAREWHFSATTREKTRHKRIAAVMLVKENGKLPECSVKSANGIIRLKGQSGDDTWKGMINLNEEPTSDYLLELEYYPDSGTIETIRIPD